MKPTLQSVHLFCVVVDNYGDIGVCWRMARQMAHEYPLRVTLWVDDLHSFHTICESVNPALNEQVVDEVRVLFWDKNHFASVTLEETGDVVIEGFGCTLPDVYIQAMAKRKTPPVWLNVEYLSAEEWVEGCHQLVSMHPSLPLKKYFFFPGFTNKTGGLLMDKDTQQARLQFEQDQSNRWAYLQRRHIPIDKQAQYISVFCYPQAPVDQLLQVLEDTNRKLIVIIPEHTATEAVKRFCGQTLNAGDSWTNNQLTVCCIPFSDQRDYDYLLWSCDMNFVRGEDSFVRAQWAGKPFVWQIYPQEEKIHLTKLDAFLDHYLSLMPSMLQYEVKRLWYAWNGESDYDASLQNMDQLLLDLANWQQYSQQWMQNLSKNGDLVTNIISFAQK